MSTSFDTNWKGFAPVQCGLPSATLDASRFSTNFHPMELDVLNYIQQVIAPKGHIVSCKLDKMDIYMPSGLVARHSKSPREPNYIGSLIVVLPVPHEGGLITVERKGRKQVLNTEQCKERLTVGQWIAFLHDCECRMEPLSSGHSVTLTYSLFCVMEPQTPISLENEQFYATLKHLVHVGDKGNKYAFILRNEYSSVELRKAQCNPLLVFKGADAIIYFSAVALGLQIEFCALFHNNIYAYPEDEPAYFSKDFPELVANSQVPEVGDSDLSDRYMKKHFNADKLSSDVKWCTPARTLRSVAGYVNEYHGGKTTTQGVLFDAALILSR